MLKNKIIVGTKHSEIFEIQEKTSAVNKLVMGHSEGELWGLAVHPSRDIYVSASYDGDIKLWNTKSKKLIKKHKTDSEIRCIDFSPDGLALATGSKDGDVFLFKISRDCDSLEKVSSNRQRNATITDIKFDYSTYILLIFMISLYN